MRFPTKEFVFSAMCALVASCAHSPEAPSAVSVASLTLNQTSATLVVGGTQRIGAEARDASGVLIVGQKLVWRTSNAAIATVTAELNGATVTAIAPGSATISAESDGRIASVAVTVRASTDCVAEDAISMAVGEVRTLTTAEKSQFCLHGETGAAEYKLIMMNLGAPTVVNLQGIGTSTVLQAPESRASSTSAATLFGTDNSNKPTSMRSHEWSDVRMLERNRQAMTSEFPNGFAVPISRKPVAQRELPQEGDHASFLVNFSNFNCTAPMEGRGARVAKVMRNVIVYVDENLPPGGFTPEQIASLAATFDTLVYPLDTLNYGVPNDVDGNQRVSVFLTPTVTATGAGVVLSRDLLPKGSCPASNVGEIVYLIVPDATLAGVLADRDAVFRNMPFLFAHELQHVINFGIRGSNFESNVLNEALSYSSAELLFYKVSGLTPGSNIARSPTDPAAREAFLLNSFLFDFYFAFAAHPDSSSVYSNVVDEPTIGALWHLMRFGADRRGGNQSAIWRSMVNTRSVGISNIASAFGPLPSLLRDWAVSQVVDDVVPNIAPNFQFPSWDLRKLLLGPYPLIERAVVTQPVTIGLVTGGSQYFQFRVAMGALATIRAHSNGNAPTADFMLVRTK